MLKGSQWLPWSECLCFLVCLVVGAKPLHFIQSSPLLSSTTVIITATNTNNSISATTTTATIRKSKCSHHHRPCGYNTAIAMAATVAAHRRHDQHVPREAVVGFGV